MSPLRLLCVLLVLALLVALGPAVLPLGDLDAVQGQAARTRVELWEQEADETALAVLTDEIPVPPPSVEVPADVPGLAETRARLVAQSNAKEKVVEGWKKLAALESSRTEAAKAATRQELEACARETLDLAAVACRVEADEGQDLIGFTNDASLKLRWQAQPGAWTRTAQLAFWAWFLFSVTLLLTLAPWRRALRHTYRRRSLSWRKYFLCGVLLAAGVWLALPCVVAGFLTWQGRSLLVVSPERGAQRRFVVAVRREADRMERRKQDLKKAVAATEQTVATSLARNVAATGAGKDLDPGAALALTGARSHLREWFLAQFAEAAQQQLVRDRKELDRLLLRPPAAPSWWLLGPLLGLGLVPPLLSAVVRRSSPALTLWMCGATDTQAASLQSMTATLAGGHRVAPVGTAGRPDGVVLFLDASRPVAEPDLRAWYASLGGTRLTVPVAVCLTGLDNLFATALGTAAPAWLRHLDEAGRRGDSGLSRMHAQGELLELSLCLLYPRWPGALAETLRQWFTAGVEFFPVRDTSDDLLAPVQWLIAQRAEGMP